MTKTRGYLKNVIVLIIALLVSFGLAEIGFRFVLFSDVAGLDKLRNPANYADYFSEDDYYKLEYLFGQPPPQHPHPLLGWVGDFSGENFLHHKAGEVGNRRAVLLYGDSFAECRGQVLCFQDILNKDEEFAQEHYLLNYGVSGYGVDQIALLVQNSVHLYEHPYAVVSLMTLDLDRSVLSVRLGQKPYFEIENEVLQLKGVPINPNPNEYFTDNPPQVKSYVYRRILYGYMPQNFIAWVNREESRITYKKKLNSKIILKIVKEMRDRDLDFVFLVFHPHWPGVSTLDGESDWRDPFLRELLEQHDIPYIWAKDIFRTDIQSRDDFTIDEYIVRSNGHPTTYFNELVAAEIKRYVMESRLESQSH